MVSANPTAENWRVIAFALHGVPFDACTPRLYRNSVNRCIQEGWIAKVSGRYHVTDKAPAIARIPEHAMSEAREMANMVALRNAGDSKRTADRIKTLARYALSRKHVRELAVWFVQEACGDDS
jgi:hypothetical protein